MVSRSGIGWLTEAARRAFAVVPDGLHNLDYV